MFKKIIAKINEKVNAAAINTMAAAKSVAESKSGAMTVEAAILIVAAVVAGALYLDKTTSVLTTFFTRISSEVLAFFD